MLLDGMLPKRLYDKNREKKNVISYFLPVNLMDNDPVTQAYV